MVSMDGGKCHEYPTYNDSSDGFCAIESFLGYNHATRCDDKLFIVSSSTSKLSTDFWVSRWVFGRERLSILCNIKCFNDILSIHEITGINYVCTQCIIRVGYTSTAKAFLKLKVSLSPVVVNPLNLLIIRVFACLV